MDVYFDSSGGEGDPNSQCVTLVGICALGDDWAKFDTEWTQTLRRHKVPVCRRGTPYWHSYEAFHRQNGFDGWEPDQVWALAVDLLQALNETPVNSLRAFSVTVVLDDFRRLKQEIPALRKATYKQLSVDVCLGYTLTAATEWQIKVANVAWTFDQNDPFEPVMRRYFRSNPYWSGIRARTCQADSRVKFPLQACDFVAWVLNRYFHNREKYGWNHIAAGIMHVVDLRPAYLNYELLRKLFDDNGRYVPDAEVPHVPLGAPIYIMAEWQERFLGYKFDWKSLKTEEPPSMPY